MFGSLVLVFPTKHEGGALVFRHRGQSNEYVFDSGAELSAQNEPSVGYAAFFSDVEHEVRPVTSGHRITLTFNLYFAEIASTLASHPTAGPTSQQPRSTPIAASISSLLASNHILADGGVLGFGLRHVYPVRDADELDHVPGLLKGPDLLLWRVLSELGLGPFIYWIYTKDRDVNDTSSDALVSISSRELELNCEDEVEEAIRESGGTILRQDTDVLWVTEPNGLSGHSQSYVTYGNEPSVEYMYVDLCLIVHVGRPGMR